MKIVLMLFIILPIIEMWLLITVGGIIGALFTIGLVLLTACIGLALLRYQGQGALLRARQKLSNNQLPGREMADGLFFVVGGALLLTPGFVTDSIGFACLTPGIRMLILQGLSRYFFRSAMAQGDHGSQGRSAHQTEKRNRVIDGDFKRESD